MKKMTLVKEEFVESKPYTVTSENGTIIIKLTKDFYDNTVDGKTGLSNMEALMVGLRRDVGLEVLKIESQVKNPPNPDIWSQIQYV